MGKSSTRKAKRPPTEVLIIGELFDEVETEVAKTLLECEPGDEVTILIDSNGGSVYSALAICAMLRYRKLVATAIVLAECSSAAFLVFSRCQHRLVTRRSVFLLHRVRWHAEKEFRAEEASNWATHFSWLENEIDAMQCEGLGLPRERLAKWVDEGRFVVGSELVDIGVAELIDL